MEKIFYISAGFVGGDGSKDRPFGSFIEARDTIRTLRAAGTVCAGDAVTVLVHGGEYDFAETFVLDERDAGREGAPMTYRACDGEKVVISGGRTLKTERFYRPDAADVACVAKKYPEAAERIVAYDLIADGIKIDDGLQVYWNGNRAILARYPNTAYSFMDEVTGTEVDAEGNPCGSQEGTGKVRQWDYEFTDPDNIVETWESVEGVKIDGNFYIDWASTSGYLTGRDPEKHRVSIHCNGEARKGGRYYFSNILDELDIPGEYYVDAKRGILYFYPEQDITETEVIVTQCPEFVVKVTSDYVTLEDFTIETAKDSLVRIEGTGDIVRGCTIRRCRKSGILFDGYKALFSHNEIYNIGGEGIDMGGGDQEKMLPSESEISDNVFHDFGEIFRVYNGGIFFRGRGITCLHNEFYNAPHLAMSMLSGDLVIEYNYIHDVCYEANDAGAVYLGGWSANDVCFCHNLIKHIVNIYKTGAPNGFYNDDGGAGKIARANLFIDIDGNAFAMGGGRDNIITDNIMINTRLAYDERLYYDQWEMHNAIYPTAGLWNNLILHPAYGSKEWAIRYPRTTYIKATNVRDYQSRFVPYALGHATVRSNVTVANSPVLRRNDVQPDTIRLANFRDNLHFFSIDDIGFVDYEGGDYRLRPDSRVLYELPGFDACDFTLCGVR